MCCIVTGGADFLKRDKEKDGLIFFSVPGFVVICFAFGKMFYIYLICMSKHTHILMAWLSCVGQRTTFMGLFSIFSM